MQPIPLYTSSSSFPWYKVLSPRAIPLPSEAAIQDENTPRDVLHFGYRYAIFRNGVFYRWEQPSDGPEELQPDADVPMEDEGASDGTGLFHEVPLRLLHDRELYVVQDVLGVTGGHLDIEHIREPSEPTMKTADSLLRKADRVSSAASMKSAASGKHVGFAPTPAPFSPKIPGFRKQPVHLNSTDGLVVVSAFLPVVLHRSDDGLWSADWDYEKGDWKKNTGAK